MKKRTLLLTLALAGLFASCDKKSTTTPTNNNTNPTNNTTTDWNWTGTPPFSVKIDGVAYPLDTTKPQIMSFAGYTNIIVEGKNGVSLGLSIEANAEAGKEYSMPSPDNISYTDQNNSKAYQAKSGKVKIITNSATVLEGMFSVTLYDPTGTLKETPQMTEGYFKINK